TVFQRSSETEPAGLRPVFRLALAAIAGLLGGVAVAVLAERHDHRVRSARILLEEIDTTILGIVPHVRRTRPPVALKGSWNRLGLWPRDTAAREVLRLVRSALLTLLPSHEGSGRRVVFTSSIAAEGTTTLVANLAGVFAAAGHRVLLI